jgi:hypothetical protein
MLGVYLVDMDYQRFAIELLNIPFGCERLLPIFCQRLLNGTYGLSAKQSFAVSHG